MAGRIPQHFIDELLNRVDIVDVIDSRVPLRKAGRDYQARCPFHEEKSPSFTVSQNKQFYHCFGCGAHGSAIGFLMEYEHLEFVEAIKELAHQSGMELPTLEAETPAQKQAPELHLIMQEAATYYQQQLTQHEQSPAAIQYLKDRGLSGKIVSEFGIGFAPPGWDNLNKALGNTAQRREQLITTGMAVRKDNHQYDRFRQRIMFPIRDRRGRVIAFGGRVIDNNDTPKYLNSPESPLFHKGRELYGLYEVRQALRQIDRLLVVEGYMDVVALAQQDIRYAVATLGTALTPEHIQPLFRTSSEVVFCFDGDRAGRDAAWKALDIMLPEIKEERSARFMFLPDGEDPDSLVRSIGKADFEQHIEHALSLATFLLDNLTQRVDMSAIDGRARLVELAKPKLSRINNAVFKQMIVTELAQRVGIDVNELMTLLGMNPRPGSRRRQAPQAAQKHRNLSPVRTAITLLLNRPGLAQLAGQPDRYQALSEPGITLLVSLLETCQQHPNISCGSILERWRDQPEGKHLNKLAQSTVTTPEDGIEAEFLGSLWRLERLRVDQEYEQLMRKSTTSQLSPEEKLKIHQLLAEKKSLARPPGTS